MNIGRLITDPDDKGYDPERWVSIATANNAEMWLEQLNDDAAHNDGPVGEASRAVLRSSASIVARRSDA